MGRWEGGSGTQELSTQNAVGGEGELNNPGCWMMKLMLPLSQCLQHWYKVVSTKWAQLQLDNNHRGVKSRNFVV